MFPFLPYLITVPVIVKAYVQFLYVALRVIVLLPSSIIRASPDRKKAMINVSGLKAYPREIEDYLYEHPKVAMAAAIGVPREDDPSNEFVKAFIVPKDGVEASPEEFIEWARDKMAGYKRPQEVDLVDELPMTNVGKVLRRVLREQELKKRGMA
ncbi:MAG: hypothetical protein GF309_02255 [Candidatus Lokiarchaeota archaeon]|nr:hypothetical protein [Candidatus Lokiarchaeota archaeon]